MSNVTKTYRWDGTGVVDPASSGRPVMAMTRPRHGILAAFGGAANPWSGVQQQA